MLLKKTRLFFRVGLLLIFIACRQQQPANFEVLSSSKTHIGFTNKQDDRQNLSILSYIYYYNGGGVAIGDINNDGLPDIYFTSNSKGQNKLYLNKGNFEFQDITQEANVAGTSDWCTGVTMADVNGDGFLDIYVCAIANMHGLRGHNELFINNGNGKFTESSHEFGLDFSGFSTQAVFFDYDHDGDLDCLVLNQSEHPNQNIVDTSFRRKFDSNSGEHLFRNEISNGQRKFTDVSARTGIYQSKLCYGLGIAVGDLNNDGWEDIYIGNDFHENDYYYVNNRNGTFTESGANHFRHYSRYSMGNDIADFNNDGQLDIITADMLPGDEKTLKTYGNGENLDTYNQKIVKNGYQNQYSRNCLQRNNGDGISFSDIGLMSGIAATDWSWSPLFLDLDNDGNKDLFISSGITKRPLDLDFIMFFSNLKNPASFGDPSEFQKAMLDRMPDGLSHPYFFKGDGHLHFEDMSQKWGTGGMKGVYNGAAYADLDNDGKLDVVVNCLNAPAIILKNNMAAKSYISISFKGNRGNSSGIGVKAYVFTKKGIQYQQLMLTRGFMSSCEPRLHFGLDSLKTVDSILVVWPGQKFQLLKNVPANKTIVFSETDAKSAFDANMFFPWKNKMPVEFTNETLTRWKHQENNFIDFNDQYLIPHMLSTLGPRLAVADINQDGLGDFFVCGAKGQPGCLFVQTKTGKFIESDTSVFAKNKESECVDAYFFDANGDGYPDLYVVSGGNEYDDGNPNLADHLYINNGKGHFSEDVNAIPKILKNKSCIAVGDFNKDGHPDVFIGGLTTAKKYGYEKQRSYLLMSDGKGHFIQASDSVFALNEQGIVTSAAVADVNHDGWDDLIVAGEWMPVRIFLNDRGILKPTVINQSSGLWQSVFLTDINGDGYADIIAGNWGKNSKLFAGKNDPLRLYVKDFDGNGSIEQIMTYSMRGNDYSFLGKDQLERALPILKKNHLSYDEVAGKTVHFMFGDLLNGSVSLQAETLSSSYFLNDGKGNFTQHELPDELQLSPIFTFISIPAKQPLYFTIGNFYGVLPYEGRYDAMNPMLFEFDKKLGQFNYLFELPHPGGEYRDAKWINSVGGNKILVIARNNDSLIYLALKRTQL